MQFLLNLIWHIPFCGFMVALAYALMGLLMCCTIVLIPAGKAYFELASYFLAPGSRALVNKEDVAQLNGETYSQGAYTTILRVLYFPFGCIAAFSAGCLIITEAISIIGIPCALVWVGTFSSLFNPFNKVCVSKEVAEQIDAMKKGITPATQAGAQAATSAYAQAANTVRNYDMEKLQEIVANAETYNPDLVQKCQTEIEVRTKAVGLAAKAENTAEEELKRIVAEPMTYAPEWIYACELQLAKIQQIKNEEEKKRREEARLKAEAEAAQKKAEMEAWWKKNCRFVYAGIAASVALILVLYFTSNGWHHKQGIKAVSEKNNIEKAIKHLSKIKNSKSEVYADAQYNLFLINLNDQRDTAEACKNLRNAVCNNNWMESVGAYTYYARYKADGAMEPYISKDLSAAADLYLESPYHEDKLCAVKCLFNDKKYNKAVEVFEQSKYYVDSDNQTLAVAQRYAALVYRYGLHSNEPDWKTALDYFKKSFEYHGGAAEDYAEYGDLLVLSYLNGNIYDIKHAAEYYEKAYFLAAADNVFKQSYKDRHEIAAAVYGAYEADSKIPYYEKTYPKWDSYTFSIGSYHGMTRHSYPNRYAKGWGIFKFDEAKEIRLSKWNDGDATGMTLSVSVNGYRLGEGYGPSGHIKKGIINWKGNKEIGTFDKWTMVKGVEYNIHGKVINRK